ncbi:MAG: CHC2 zinc finger domain-containing protein, partial [Candidatus Sumerlaeaceae bacterium]|nr:CHC2 zinc finger domain-containing protein [Candidatus Sumerlaeaceae bacterium]
MCLETRLFADSRYPQGNSRQADFLVRSIGAVMAEYPEKVIAEINRSIEPRRLMEMIGYMVNKLQESGDTVRGCCPIHREKLFRNLIIQRKDRTFRCTHRPCPGAAGGDLVTLYALAKEVTRAEAAADLATAFSVDVSCLLYTS